MPNPKPNAGHNGRAIAAATIAGMWLSACAMSDDSLSSFLVAPGNYVLFTCDDIARTAKTTQARQKELEQLMAKASTDTGGRIIADAAYGTEYATTRGQMKNLRAAAAERKCDFVPGADNSAAPASDSAIH
ncbi:MAG TPA: hypothetical protein VLN61_00205 [Pseudolabrys sp.]|nr:hypothetical protein [Pseudolabrys sp.]